MPSSLIDTLVRHCDGIEPVTIPADLPHLPTLTQVLDRIPDHRRRQGRRYRLGMILTLCAVAVLCGAKSLAQIVRLAHGWDTATLARLGIHTRPRTGEPHLPVATTVPPRVIRMGIQHRAPNYRHATHRGRRGTRLGVRRISAGVLAA